MISKNIWFVWYQISYRRDKVGMSTMWNRQPKKGKEGYSAYGCWKSNFRNNESRIDNNVDQQVRKGGGWGENGH